MAMNGDIWTVDTVTVLITTTTEIRGNPQLGDFMKVSGVQQADGSVLAHEIKVIDGTPGPTRTPEPTETGDHHPSETPPSHHEVDFSGTVASINGDTWVIGSTTVMVTSKTRIGGNPQVGDTVRVVGLQQEDGTVQALAIMMKSGTSSNGDHNQGGNQDGGQGNRSGGQGGQGNQNDQAGQNAPQQHNQQHGRHR